MTGIKDLEQKHDVRTIDLSVEEKMLIKLGGRWGDILGMCFKQKHTRSLLQILDVSGKAKQNGKLEQHMFYLNAVSKNLILWTFDQN